MFNDCAFNTTEFNGVSFLFSILNINPIIGIQIIQQLPFVRTQLTPPDIGIEQGFPPPVAGTFR